MQCESRRLPGSGLSLSTGWQCVRIAKLHGGAVDVKEAGGKHAVGRGVSLNGKVLRGREMRCVGGGG